MARDDEEPTGPYVLFLIRPDGIASYYKAQSSLKGYQLDFGYELVDAGWTLGHADDLRQHVQTFFGAPIRVDVEIHDRLAAPR